MIVRSRLAVAVTLVAALAGCGSRDTTTRYPLASSWAGGAPPGQWAGAQARSTAPAGPAAPAPLRPAQPAPLDLAALAGAVFGLAADLPCPPPGLPPELAARLDCAALRPIAGATAYMPLADGAALPAAVDLRASGLAGPVKNQEQVGACAGFALSSVVDNAVRRMGRADVVAPLHVFAKYGHGNGLEKVRGVPLTVEPVWPYDPARACRFAGGITAGECGAVYGVAPGSAYSDPGLQMERTRADVLGHYRVDAFEQIGNSPRDVAAILSLVAHGEAVWIAMGYDVEIWNGPAARTGHFPPYKSQGVAHAVVVEGFRSGPLGREILLHNSWGPGWGEAGYAWMDEATFALNLVRGYRLRVSESGPSLPAAAPQLPSWPAVPQLPSWPATLPTTLPATAWPFPFPPPR